MDQPTRKTSGKSIAAFILGIVALVWGVLAVDRETDYYVLGAGVPAVLAVVLGILGLREVRLNPELLRGERFAASAVGIPIGCLFLVLFLVATVLPHSRGFRDAVARTRSKNNLKHIALALMNYTTTRHRFPDPAVRDSGGRPLLSWRVENGCASEGALVVKPDNVTFEQAAAAPVAAFTALQGLRDKGRIQPEQKALINGAAGGVGTFAVQIAKSFGADVTGVCSTRNVDMVRSIGADYVIDYTQVDFTKNEQRYDVVLDCVGNH